MEIQMLINAAVDNGHRALSEFDSKKVLAAYHIPVSQEYLVTTPEEAAQKAMQIGFPVVLKACSHTIAHKTEGGLVEAAISTREAVLDSFERIMKKAGTSIDGILVQEMVQGQRELCMGLVRDPQFGPCVMVGFGGIMTEVINDTCFRMAPIDEREAGDMLDELKTKAILGPFRGLTPVDRAALCTSLVAIGQIGMEHPAITEIDINPLIIRRDGTFAAVDALVVLEGEENDRSTH